MISIDAGPCRKVLLFMSPDEISILRDIAAQSTDWQPGRQGSGYFKLDISELALDPDEEWIQELIQRATLEICKFAGLTDAELILDSDVYLLYYPDGSSVPAHKDPVPAGSRHIRLNAVVTRPEHGGRLKLVDADTYYDPEPGDGLVFSPSDLEHAVERIIGSRLVFSVGARVNDPL